MKITKVSAAVVAAGCFFINGLAQATVPEDKAVVSNKPAPVVKVTNEKGKPVTKVKSNDKNLQAKEQKAKQQFKLREEQAKPKDNKNLLKLNEQHKTLVKPEAKKPVKKEMFGGMELPVDYKKIPINGEAVATKGQAVNLIKQTNPDVKLECSVEEIVDLYWVEAQRESVRPDIALAQALVETGYFRFGGNVKPKQNNFCGLGTTGKGVRGAKFKTPEIGVRAHIQHLLAYTHKNKPSTKIVDPRYELAHSIRLERGIIDTWYGLNGTWAMGANYCEKIMVTYQRMLQMEMSEAEKAERQKQQALDKEQLKEQQKREKEAAKKAAKEAKRLEKERKRAEKEARKRREKEAEHKMRERVDKILREEKMVKNK